MRTTTIVLLLLAAGCTSAEPDPSYAVGGTFTERATQDEMNAFAAFVDVHGGDLALLESFPVQFRATGLAWDDCEAVRERGLDLPFVASIGWCEDERPLDDRDEPIADKDGTTARATVL